MKQAQIEIKGCLSCLYYKDNQCLLGKFEIRSIVDYYYAHRIHDNCPLETIWQNEDPSRVRHAWIRIHNCEMCPHYSEPVWELRNKISGTCRRLDYDDNQIMRALPVGYLSKHIFEKCPIEDVDEAMFEKIKREAIEISASRQKKYVKPVIESEKMQEYSTLCCNGAISIGMHGMAGNELIDEETSDWILKGIHDIGINLEEINMVLYT